ncbi:MAG: hypothetical protein KAT70_01290, partial [Thermoplasmata archaeon]|nr:hypothetical protein [Thermoplasmata archaeon]
PDPVAEIHHWVTVSVMDEAGYGVNNTWITPLYGSDDMGDTLVNHVYTTNSLTGRPAVVAYLNNTRPDPAYNIVQGTFNKTGLYTTPTDPSLVNITIPLLTDIIGMSGFGRFPNGNFVGHYTLKLNHSGNGDPVVYTNVTFPGYPAGMSEAAVNSTTEKHTPVIISGLPLMDLEIGAANITFAPTHPVDGDDVDVTARIYNLGDRAVPAGTVVSFIDMDTMEVVGNCTLLALDATGSDFEDATVTWTNLASGMHIIKIVVDPDNIIWEGDEENNEATAQIGVNVTKDLSLTLDITPNDHIVSGEQVSIFVNVTLVGGGVPLPWVNVSFYDNGAWLHNETISILPNGLYSIPAVPWL